MPPTASRPPARRLFLVLAAVGVLGLLALAVALSHEDHGPLVAMRLPSATAR